MVMLIDMEIIGDSASTLAMIDAINLRLSPAPLAGWMLGVVEPVLKHETLDNFASESDPKGSPWAPLAPSTIANRESEGYPPAPIQYRSGEMYAFFEGAMSDIIATQLGTTMTWPGTPPTDKLPYKIGSAQKGNRRTGAPPRPVLGLTLQDGEKIMLGLFKYVTGATA